MSIISKFYSSRDLEVSTANQELIQRHKPEETTVFGAKKISFLNNEECHIAINESEWLYLRAGQGMELDLTDETVEEFRIKESGITFNYILGC